MTAVLAMHDDDGEIRYEVTGDYLQCDTCHAPVLEPFPEDWRMGMTVTVLRDAGPRLTYHRQQRQVHLTPHMPGCTAP